LGFSWTGVPHATSYSLKVGRSPGTSDSFSSGGLPSTQTSIVANGLPVGQVLYARLSTQHENLWYDVDSSFTAAVVPVQRATFTSIATDGNYMYGGQAFAWTTVPNAQAYYLYVGTTQGANNLVNTGEIQTTSYSATTLPTNTLLYARLWTKVDGVWRYVDRT